MQVFKHLLKKSTLSKRPLMTLNQLTNPQMPISLQLLLHKSIVDPLHPRDRLLETPTNQINPMSHMSIMNHKSNSKIHLINQLLNYLRQELFVNGSSKMILKATRILIATPLRIRSTTLIQSFNNHLHKLNQIRLSQSMRLSISLNSKRR